MEKKTRKRNMVMTNEEIVKSYREAKDRRAQIKVLAELNVCPQELIVEILKEGGVDWRELPRKKKAEPFVLADKAVEGGRSGQRSGARGVSNTSGAVSESELDRAEAGVSVPTDGGKPTAEMRGEAHATTEGEAKVVVVEPVCGIVAEALEWYRADLVRTVNKLREEYEAIVADYAAKISEIDVRMAGVKGA